MSGSRVRRIGRDGLAGTREALRDVGGSVNRRRYDVQRTLETFRSGLCEQTELGALSADRRGVAVETMQPTHASLWLREGGTQ